MGGIYKYTLKNNIDQKYPKGRVMLGNVGGLPTDADNTKTIKRASLIKLYRNMAMIIFIFEILEYRKYSGTTKIEFIDYHMC